MRLKVYKLLAVLTVIAMGACGYSCSQRKWFTYDGAVWSTTFHIVYHAPVSMEDSIMDIMKAVDSSLSPFNKDSKISAINSNRDLTVDSLISRIMDLSLYVNDISCGAFDPTVAPAINYWGFGYKDLSSSEETLIVDSLKRLVGLGECRVDSGIMVKKSPQTEFNFSAIAKGFGCDLIRDMFRRNGVDDYLIEIGGEICAGGVNPSGNDWHIMIVTPDGLENGTGDVFVDLTNCGMATSGNYRNYRDTPDGRIGHTIDPVTCRPVITDVFSATVIAPSAVLADALATACMVLTPDDAIQMIDSVEGAEVLLIENVEQSDPQIRMTDGFKKYFHGNQKL